MKQYPDEFKASIITKLLAPNNAGIPALAKESGIPKDTLYSWRIKHRRRDQQLKAEKIDDNSKINSSEKFDIVIETAHMNQAELSAYCRSKGLYPEQIDAWRTQCRQANTTLGTQADRKKFNEQTKEIRLLKSELNRKEKALAEAATLLILKKSSSNLGRDRGRLTPLADRHTILKLIDNATAAGARLSGACAVLEISPRTVQRWQLHQYEPDQRKSAAQQRLPENKLSEKEREKIVTICNQKQFANMAPNQIVPILADQGTYVASESSFYRVLRQEDQLAHRGKAKAPRHKRPEVIEATGPNELWSWDITYLPTTIKGLFFYLYMIMDVYSRKIVGWEVHDSELADHSSMLIRKTYLREGVAGKPLVLHSDNGSPMKGATMLVTLQKLGVMPSFSRPSVSNDNPYSEALFKTLKYTQGYPDKPFDSIEQAQQWVLGFYHWYNETHRHSALKFVTPGQRHRGEDVELLKKRAALYDEAKDSRPERWSGATRNWQHEQVVYLNPTKSDQKIRKAG